MKEKNHGKRWNLASLYFELSAERQIFMQERRFSYIQVLLQIYTVTHIIWCYDQKVLRSRHSQFTYRHYHLRLFFHFYVVTYHGSSNKWCNGLTHGTSAGHIFVTLYQVRFKNVWTNTNAVSIYKYKMFVCWTVWIRDRHLLYELNFFAGSVHIYWIKT